MRVAEANVNMISDQSHPLVTAEEMRNLDRQAIEERGVPGVVLMENAGRGCAEVVLDLLEEIDGDRVAVFCGPGNNGGDGFVIARHLRNRGVAVDVFMLTHAEKLKGDARINFEILARSEAGLPLELLDDDDLLRHDARLLDADIVVDAILGTGLKREMSGLFNQVIERINDLGKPVVAVDIPSGLCADTGMPLGWAVQAAATVTFGCLKRGQLTQPGASLCGDLYMADIGIPAELIDDLETGVRLLGLWEVLELLPERREDGHKGTFGHCLAVAGRPGFSGAAALTGLGALRSGAALATLAAPEGTLAAAMVHAPELMGHAIELGADGTPTDAALEALVARTQEMKAVAVGPGLGDSEATRKLLLGLLRGCETPIVLDADGLNVLAGRPELLAEAKGPVVVTPHPGEMARLCSKTTDEVQANRIELARDFSRAHGVHVVLKGSRTVCANPDGRAWVVPTGNSGLATAGSGDVLTGVIAGLIAQGVGPGEAGRLGAFLHGLAGDLAAVERSAAAMTSSDVLHYLSDAFGLLEGGEEE